MEKYFTLLFICFSFLAQAATVTWVGGTGGWDVPANWDTGTVPTASDDVRILTGGHVTIPSGYSASAQSANLSGINNNLSLTIESSATLTIIDDNNSGAALFVNKGTVTNNGDISASNFYSVGILMAATSSNFHNYGNIIVSNGGGGSVGSGGIISFRPFYNYAGGLIQISNVAGSGMITGTTAGGVIGNISNEGTIELLTPMTVDGLRNHGYFTNQDCGVLLLGDNRINSNSPASSFINRGWIRQNYSGSNSISTTSLNNGAIENIQGASYGAINNQSYIVSPLTGTFTEGVAVSPALSGNGTGISLTGNAFYTTSALTTSAGTFDAPMNTWTPNAAAVGLAVFYMKMDDGNGCPEVMEIHLSSAVQAAPCTALTPNNWTGNGDGISWDDAANWSDGVPQPCHQVTSGPDVVISGMASAAKVTIPQFGTLTIQPAGTLDIDGGFSGNSGKGFDMERGTLNNDGILLISNISGGEGLYTGNASVVNNSGSISIDNVFDAPYAACSFYTTTVNNTGSVKIGAGSTIAASGLVQSGGLITNDGLISVENATQKGIDIASGTLANNDDISLDNIGDIPLYIASSFSLCENQGSINTSGTAGPQSVLALFGNGQLSGNGSFGNDKVANLGKVMPGSSVGSLGFSGNVSLTGNYVCELEGTSGAGVPGGNDVIAAGGTGQFGGTLTIEFLSGFAPSIGDEFTIMTCTGGCSGAFASIVHPGNNPNAWEIVMTDPSTVVLRMAESLLPLELLSFSVKKTNENKTLLFWETATEKNTSHFEIERSMDGINWEYINEIPAAGYSDENIKYHFSDLYDERILATSKSHIYYRLRMVDADGSFEHSPVRSIFLENNGNGFSIYPNPASDYIFIKSEKYMEGEMEVILLDNMGWEVFGEKIYFPENEIYELKNMEEVPEGLYFVLIKKNGQVMWEDKVVKK